MDRRGAMDLAVLMVATLGAFRAVFRVLFKILTSWQSALHEARGRCGPDHEVSMDTVGFVMSHKGF